MNSVNASTMTNEEILKSSTGAEKVKKIIMLTDFKLLFGSRY